MGPEDFRRVALGMDGAIEAAHMGHPDFRVNNRIFATLHPDRESGMVKLTPDQQRTFVRANAASFSPESGAWGRAGCTRVLLKSVDEDRVGEAMTLAWQNIARRPAAGRARPQRSVKPARTSRKR